ncbi:ankyrin repeat domain-containing protein [Acidicapsa acidisoli]|uniref:ankyrin repeat domain-containing protein n=1 Tax=Acidicapsa acidisoli TaxID=1615681 RepID=UPI0021E0B494|nr:ankyrin repeat domain-containing protein [Acidicapsa acidisoli]
MFPNPQSALPLPPRPSLERYRKIAKELVKACRSGSKPTVSSDEPDAISLWGEAWIDDLVRLTGLTVEPQLPVRIESWIDGVAEFARRQLGKGEGDGRTCTLADAQFVIARSHGFESWPKFARHLEALQAVQSPEWRFEATVDAIVSGDIALLERLLTEEPGLVQARSMREHGATLLHYVAANGVEGYRQKTPQNIVEIAAMLLRAGADVNATANVYGGGSTTLGLAATSGHPDRAGVQEELLRVLLEHGAKIPDGTVRVCLANGRAKAAEFLASRVGHLSLAEAAGVGRLDLVEPDLVASLGKDAALHADAAREELQNGLLFSCQFGHDSVVDFLLKMGVDPKVSDGRGQTALHHAVIGGHATTVRLLLEHKAPLEAKNSYGGTVLDQALWSAAHGGDPDAYIAILEALTAAGARMPEGHVPVNSRVDAWLDEHGSRAEPGWYWSGEKPRDERQRNSRS